MESTNYPAVLYRDGILSGDPTNQRTVRDAESELAAAGDGFERWHTKPGAATAEGKTAPDVAAAASFAKADKRVPPKGSGKAAA